MPTKYEGPKPGGGPYREKKPVKLTEAHIQRTCDDWLVLDGWRRVITDPPRLRGLGVTEPGIADGLYIRYRVIKFVLGGNAYTETMWVEWKRALTHKANGQARFSKAGLHQLEWHRAERARGALTLIAGDDFPATIEGFQDWYRKSGLRRNQSL